MSQSCLFVSVCLSLVLLSNGSMITEQSSGVKLSCDLKSITADEPSITYRFEAGVSEFWDQFTQQFICAGVEAVRNVIQPNGLLLPHYIDAPQLIYILNGTGIEGTVLPGCANGYESKMGDDEDQPGDRHQKVHKFREGDVLALPAGITHWFYNNGDIPVVTLSVFNVKSGVNQLDQKFRIFFLAGNYPIQQGEGSSNERDHKEGGFGNIFTNLDEQILANSYNVNPELVTKLKGKFDHRGRIVMAENLTMNVPNSGEVEQEKNNVGEVQGRNLSGEEDSLCTMKIRENLAVALPDWYNPGAGSITSLNSQKLQHLNLIQLSADRGVLYKHAILAPHWNINAHSIMYITKGTGLIQVADQTGNLLFNGEVRTGQLIILPQYFVMMMKAGEQGCEWIAVKTNANAKISTLVGQQSVVKSIPVEVLMKSYNISRVDAKKLKINRKESILLSPSNM